LTERNLCDHQNPRFYFLWPSQAAKYSSGFETGAIYHTNSLDFASYYDSLFKEAGFDSIRFFITPVVLKE
jgi:hypothetical protein